MAEVTSTTTDEKLGNEVFAVLTYDTPGQEGMIMGIVFPGMPIMPAITVKREVCARMVETARLTGRKFKVKRYANPEDVTAEF